MKYSEAWEKLKGLSNGQCVHIQYGTGSYGGVDHPTCKLYHAGDGLGNGYWTSDQKSFGLAFAELEAWLNGTLPKAGDEAPEGEL